MTLDAPAARLTGFANLLRGSGFPVSTDQSISYLEAVRALGPRDFNDLWRAAMAIFAPPMERRGEFKALFEQHFLLRTQVVADSDEAEETPQSGEGEQIIHIEEADLSQNPGQRASNEQVGNLRHLIPLDDDRALRYFSRLAPKILPKRLTRRFFRARNGFEPDRLRSFREALRTDGEILSIRKKRRSRRLRPVLLLIDISGSMKENTMDALRFALVLMRLKTEVEVFSLGTRLTRISPALRLRSQSQALNRVSELVDDFDGGTRLGETLEAFLSIPRYAGFARGAIVITLSDGLETGQSNRLVNAVRKLYSLAFFHLWLTPLADRSDFIPQTEALIQIQPYIDQFGSAKSIPHICAGLLEPDLTKMMHHRTKLYR